MTPAQEGLVIRYLMGELSREESTDIEKRFFTEPGFLDSVRAMEEQLIRDALAGGLSPDQQLRFENHFLSFPDLRSKYEATKALRDALGPAQRTTSLNTAPIAGQWARLFMRKSYAAVLALTACLAIAWLALDNVRLRSDPTSRIAATRKTLLAPLTLEPGLVRSGAAGQSRLLLPPEAVLVEIRLRIELPDQYSSYQAILANVDSGRERLRVSGLVSRPAGSFRGVMLEIPASVLTDGFYILTLNAAPSAGLEPVETYSFQVIHQ